MFPAFFGGEGGISGNRVTGRGLFGITYGTQLQMYFLVAGWAAACTLGTYALTQTPLGRLANAVRDNPERVQFIGCNPQRVRYLMVVLAGFVAGIAGGLAALQYEIVTAEALSDATSGSVILMAFVGGTGAFYGPILGAALITTLQVSVASVTPAWPFYFGLFFLVMVLYAPHGIAGILEEHRQVFRAGLLRTLAPGYLVAALPAALLAFATVALVEMAYALVNGPERGTTRLTLLFVPLDGATRASWAGALAALLLALFLLGRAWRLVVKQWQSVHAALSPQRERP
jgi:branched-chain amino acid transport system permease protein